MKLERNLDKKENFVHVCVWAAVPGDSIFSIFYFPFFGMITIHAFHCQFEGHCCATFESERGARVENKQYKKAKVVYFSPRFRGRTKQQKWVKSGERPNSESVPISRNCFDLFMLKLYFTSYSNQGISSSIGFFNLWCLVISEVLYFVPGRFHKNVGFEFCITMILEWVFESWKYVSPRAISDFHVENVLWEFIFHSYDSDFEISFWTFQLLDFPWYYRSSCWDYYLKSIFLTPIILYLWPLSGIVYFTDPFQNNSMKFFYFIFFIILWFGFFPWPFNSFLFFLTFPDLVQFIVIETSELPNWDRSKS